MYTYPIFVYMLGTPRRTLAPREWNPLMLQLIFLALLRSNSA